MRLVKPTCPSCGSAVSIPNAANTVSCTHCGNNLFVDYNPSGAVFLLLTPPSASQSVNPCPRCGQTDTVQALRAMARNTDANAKASMATYAAALMKAYGPYLTGAPPQPTTSSGTSCGEALKQLLLTFGALGGLVILAISLAGKMRLVSFGGLALCVFFVATLMLRIRGQKRTREEQQEAEELKRITFATNRQAAERLQQMYYCSHCDIVWVWGEYNFALPEQAATLAGGTIYVPVKSESVWSVWPIRDYYDGTRANLW
jgi:hypothetical protein